MSPKGSFGAALAELASDDAVLPAGPFSQALASLGADSASTSAFNGDAVRPVASHTSTLGQPAAAGVGSFTAALADVDADTAADPTVPRMTRARASERQYQTAVRELDAVRPPYPSELGPGNTRGFQPGAFPAAVSHTRSTTAPLPVGSVAQQRAPSVEPVPAPVSGGRPVPVKAAGVTDPTSVRVTNGPPSIGPALPNTAISPAVLSRPLERPFATTAAGQIVRGVGEVFGHPQVLPAEPHVLPPDESRRTQVLGGVADIAEGTMDAAGPLAAVGLVANPISTTAGVLASMAASKAAAKATALAGGSPEAQRVASALAAAAVAGTTADVVRRGLAAGGEAARAARVAEPASAEPTWVGRSSTVAPGANRLGPARLALPAAPEPAAPPRSTATEPPAAPSPIATGEVPASTGNAALDNPSSSANPFAAKAARLRAEYERLAAPTAHERGMADAFPLGVGSGRAGDATRADQSIDRAVRATELQQQLTSVEAQAAAFTAGHIDEGGRPISADRAARRAAADDRAARIDAAKQLTANKQPWQVPAATWADANGHLAGAPRALMLKDHRAAVAQAVAAGEVVPPEVLADYPNLRAREDVLDTGEGQPRLPADVGAVREQQLQAPTVADAPFSLQREAAPRHAVQPTLRESPSQRPSENGDYPPQPPPPEPVTAANNPREPRGVRAAEAPAETLTGAERREVRRILAELENIGYEPKRFADQLRRGSTKEVSGGAGGAPVYYDIVGGSPDHRPRFGYSRGAVVQKLRAFINDGQRSVASDLAVDVARRRLAGERGLQSPSLPPDAGDRLGAVHVDSAGRGVSPETQRIIDDLEQRGADYRARYRERFGNEFSTDKARTLLLEQQPVADRLRLNPELQKPAQALLEAVRRDALQEPTPAGKEDRVIIKAGPTGAGKSSATIAIPGMSEAEASAALTLEGTYKDFAKAERHIREALDAGHHVSVVYVHREPLPAYEHGVLRREGDDFRPITPEFHLQAHQQAPATLDRLLTVFQDDPRVEFLGIDNTRGPGETRVGDLSAIRKVRYDEHSVRSELEAALRRTTPEKAGAIESARAGSRAPNRGSDDRKPEQERSRRGSGASREGTAHRPAESVAQTRQPQVDRPADRGDAFDIDESDRQQASAPSPSGRGSAAAGAAKFLDRDVTPALKRANDRVLDVRKGLRALFAPDTVSPAATAMAGVLRTNLAVEWQQLQKARIALEDLNAAWDKMPLDAQRAFAYAIDEGHVDELPADQQATARLLAAINTQHRDAARAKGAFRGPLIAHYFPREWKQPSKVTAFLRALIYGRRPLQGRQGFRKHRSRKATGEAFSFREMVARGFTPVTENPIEAHLRKWAEMRKFITGRTVLEESKELGIAEFVPLGKRPNDPTWQPHHKSFGTVWGKPVVQVKEAYDAGLMEALHRFATSLGITVVHKINLGHNRWGFSVKHQNLIHRRVGGPEGVLMHEIGHVLDDQFALGEKIGLAQFDERREEVNFSETPSRVLAELRQLADLRLGPKPTASYRAYVRKRPEQLANLVHAFLYAPDLAKEVAPNAYWALYNLANDTPALRGLLDLQHARSLRIGEQTIEQIGDWTITGHYYGPPEAVRIPSNYLSPGLRGNVGYDLYRGIGNTMIQVKLSLSAFHPVGSGFNSFISKSALVLQQLSRGEVSDATKKAAEIPVAPAVDFLRGRRAIRAFRLADPNSRVVDAEVGALIQAGTRVNYEKMWQTGAPDRFVRALRGVLPEAKVGNYPGAALRLGTAAVNAPLAGLGHLTRLMMEEWVQPLKVAALLDMAAMELKDLGPTPNLQEVRRVLGQVGDSADNRYGQLVYDNLFWHNLSKDLSMGVVGMLGWKLGTVREVFGAPAAQARSVGLLPAAGGGGGFQPPTRLRNVGTAEGPDGEPVPVYQLGREPWLNRKFAYTIALLAWGALIGALYQYLHTGKKPGEREDGTIDPTMVPRDLYMPRTGGVKPDGKPERAFLPIYYISELLHFYRHPVDWAVGMLHPLLSLLGDVVENEDYFGTELRNPDDPILDQVRELFGAAAKAYRPISVDTFQRRLEDENTRVGAGESFLGTRPAPAWATRTALEDYMREVSPPTHRTLEQAQEAQTRAELRRDLQEGKTSEARQLAATGTLSARQVRAAESSSRYTALQRSYNPLTLDQALHAYELATQDERRVLQPILRRKVNNASVAPAQRERLRARVQAVLALPVGGADVPVGRRAQ